MGALVELHALGAEGACVEHYALPSTSDQRDIGAVALPAQPSELHRAYGRMIPAATRLRKAAPP